MADEKADVSKQTMTKETRFDTAKPTSQTEPVSKDHDHAATGHSSHLTCG
jgi:hypothetical protein